MEQLTMDEIIHKTIRTEERVIHLTGEITGLKSDTKDMKEDIKDLLEVARNLTHTVDALRVRDVEEKVSARLKVLEQAFDRAQFLWKIGYAIIASPVLIMVGVKILGYIQGLKV